jgi:hypothetical protein
MEQQLRRRNGKLRAQERRSQKGALFRREESPSKGDVGIREIGEMKATGSAGRSSPNLQHLPISLERNLLLRRQEDPGD